MPTPNLGLVQPAINPTYDLWGADMNQNLALIDAASILLRGTPVAATAPTLNQVLKFNGTSWAPGTDSGGVTGSGTTGKLSKWVGGTALGDSILSDDGVTLLVAGNVNASSYMVGGVALASTHLSDGGTLIKGAGVTGRVPFFSGAQTVTSDAAMVWDNSLKFLGVGIANPEAPIHANGQIRVSAEGVSSVLTANFYGTPVPGVGAVVSVRTARGTRAAPTAVMLNDSLGVFNGRGHDGVAFPSSGAAGMNINAAENWTTIARGTSLSWSVTPIGSIVSGGQMFLGASGNLRVGTSSDPGFRINALGEINATVGFRVGGTTLASTHLSDSLNLARHSDALGGDLTGSLPNPSISNLQGNPLLTAGAVPGNLLRFDGVNWAASFSASYELIDGNTLIRSDGLTAMGADLNLATFKIVNLGSPTSDFDAATKVYVDSVATGLDLKKSVRAATTANITLSGAQTVDGVSLLAGDRVLVKNQTTQTDNGIYDVAAGAWPRSSDADNSPAGEVTSGMFTFIEEGSTNANKGYVLVTPDPIVLGVSNLIFSQFSNVSGGLTGSGTSGKIAKWTGGTALGDSILSEAGGALAVAGNVTVTGSQIVGSFVGSGGVFGTQVLYLASTDGTGQALALASGTNPNTDIKATFEYDPSSDRIKITKGNGTVISFDRTTSNVGIGTSPDPTYRVNVFGDMNISGQYRVNGSPVGGVTGSGTANKIAFWSSGSALSSNNNFVWDNSTNRFGVGVSSPLYPIHLVTGGRHSAFDSSSGAVFISSLSGLISFPATENVTIGLSARVQANSSARLTLESGGLGTSVLYLKTAGGSFGSYSATTNGTNLGVIGGIGHDGTNFASQPNAFIRITAAETFTPSAQGTKLTLHTTAIGSTGQSERVTILASGNVGIDSTNPIEKFEVGNGGNMNLNGGGVYKTNGTQISTNSLSDGGSIIKTSTSMSGDLQGNLPNATINKIQGVSVVASSPNSGEIFYFNGSNWASNLLGGDVSGGLTAAVVTRVNGVTINGIPSTGQVIVASGSISASWQALPAAVNLKTTGADVNVGSAAPPTTGQVLTATSSNTATWQSPAGGYAATVVVAAPSGVAATDTTNIQNAINTANAAGGGTVLLREGIYLISTTINPKSGVTLKGQGKSTGFNTTISGGSTGGAVYGTTLRGTTGLGTTRMISDSGTIPHVCSFVDLNLDFGFLTRFGSGASQDMVMKGSNHTFINVSFIAFTAVGNPTVDITPTSTLDFGKHKFRGCDFYDAGTASTYTFNLDGSITDCYFEGTAASFSQLLQINSGRLTNCYFASNKAYSNAIVLVSPPANNNQPEMVVISGCMFKQYTNAQTRSILVSTAHGVAIVGCIGDSSNASVGGITVSTASPGNITGCNGFSAYTGGTQAGNI